LRDGEDGRLLANCFGGCDFADIITALFEYGLLDDDNHGDNLFLEEDHAPTSRAAATDADRIAKALAIYAEAGAGSLVATYLYECRGISLLPPAVLREHLQCPHRLGMRMRAMVAPVVDVAGTLTGVHMTFLDLDGRRKADLPKEYQRECRGVMRGGAVRLAEPDDPDRTLIIGEGIESTLAAMQLLELPGWAAIYAANLKNTLELPEAVRRVIIAADNDPAGQNAAYEARRRWMAEGRTVRVAMPSRTGTDFNDILRPGP